MPEELDPLRHRFPRLISLTGVHRALDGQHPPITTHDLLAATMREASATPILARRTPPISFVPTEPLSTRRFSVDGRDAASHLPRSGARDYLRECGMADDDEPLLPPSPPNTRSQPLAQPTDDEQPLWRDATDGWQEERQPTRREWSWDPSSDDGAPRRGRTMGHPAGHTTSVDCPTESDFLPASPRRGVSPFHSPSPMDLQLSLSPEHPNRSYSPRHDSGPPHHRPTTSSFLSSLDSRPRAQHIADGKSADTTSNDSDSLLASRRFFPPQPLKVPAPHGARFGSPTSTNFSLPSALPFRHHRTTESLDLSDHGALAPGAPRSPAFSDGNTTAWADASSRRLGAGLEALRMAPWSPPPSSTPQYTAQRAASGARRSEPLSFLSTPVALEPSASSTMNIYSPPSSARGTDASLQEAAEHRSFHCGGSPFAARFTNTDAEPFLPVSPPYASRSTPEALRRPVSPSTSPHSWSRPTTVAGANTSNRADVAARTDVPHVATAAVNWFTTSAASQPPHSPADPVQLHRPPRTFAPAPEDPLSILQASSDETTHTYGSTMMEEAAPLSPEAIRNSETSNERRASLQGQPDGGGCAASKEYDPTSSISHVGPAVQLFACLGETDSVGCVDTAAVEEEDLKVETPVSSHAHTEKTTAIPVAAALEAEASVDSVPPVATTPADTFPPAGSSKQTQPISTTPHLPAATTHPDTTPTSKPDGPSPDYTQFPPQKEASLPAPTPALPTQPRTTSAAVQHGSRRAQMLVRTAQEESRRETEERLPEKDGNDEQRFLQMENVAVVFALLLELHTLP